MPKNDDSHNKGKDASGVPLSGVHPFYMRAGMKKIALGSTIKPGLEDADFKRQWANKHLKSLKAEIEALSQRYPYEISANDDPSTGDHLVQITHPTILPGIQAVLYLGDFICSLRSALDHIAYQLASLTSPAPSREICFPIYEKNTVDFQVKIAKSTFGIPDPAVAIIKMLQPYHYGDAYKTSHLWRLNTLWNIDKHRHISPFTVLPKWQILIPEWDYSLPLPEREQIDNRTIMRIPAAFKNQVQFNPDRDIELRFFDEREGFDIGCDDLVEMYQFVSDEVFPAFAGFFPQPGVPGQTS